MNSTAIPTLTARFVSERGLREMDQTPMTPRTVKRERKVVKVTTVAVRREPRRREVTRRTARRARVRTSRVVDQRVASVEANQKGRKGKECENSSACREEMEGEGWRRTGLEESVRQRVREHLRPNPLPQVLRNPLRRRKRLNEVLLRLQRRMVRPEVREFDGIDDFNRGGVGVEGGEFERGGVGRFPAERAGFVRWRSEPLTDVAHELRTLRITVDCDRPSSVSRESREGRGKKRRTSCAPRRLTVFEARLAGVFRVVRTAELVRVAALDTTAVFEKGVGPAERGGKEEKEGQSNFERRNGIRGDGRDEVVDPDGTANDKGGSASTKW